MIITDADKLDLAILVNPVVSRHEHDFREAALVDISCHYAAWRQWPMSHEDAMWRVCELLATWWWQDTFPYEEPSLTRITAAGIGWADQAGNPWIWRGSTDFRLCERVLAGVDIRPILADRKAAGANLVRILAMKANNTGWELKPGGDCYWEAVRDTLALTADARLYVEWTVFADTRSLMPKEADQQAFYREMQEMLRRVNHVFLELLNEAGHATQQCNPSAFAKPEGLISSHGSGLTDVPPPSPFWDYATYHARRNPYPSPKSFTNWNAYVFRDGDPFPLPCPFICEEGLKPEQYAFNPVYARLMGQGVHVGGGGTFHHSAWNEARLWTDQERACAEAFYQGLQG